MKISKDDTVVLIAGVRTLTYLISELCDSTVKLSQQFDTSPEVKKWKEENEPPTSLEEAQAFQDALPPLLREVHESITKTVTRTLHLYTLVKVLARMVKEDKNPGYIQWEKGIQHFLVVTGAIQSGDFH